MKLLSDDTLHLVRSQAAEAERHGRLTGDVLSAIEQQQLFKLFVPEQMDGRMMVLPDAIRLFEEASYIDGSFGWLVTIGSGGGYFAGMIDRAVAMRLFSPAEAVIAGSGYIGGRAVKTDDGYKVTGSWKYCSGADFASIFTANVLIEGEEQVRSFIFTPDQVTVHRDWDAYGLKATGSHTITVHEVLVPGHMTFDISHGQRSNTGLLYTYPFLTFAEVSFAAVNIGICRHFIEGAKAATAVHHKSVDATMQRRNGTVQAIISEQEDILNVYAARFYEALDISWDLTAQAGLVPDAVYTEVGRWARKVTTTAVSCAQAIYPYLGLTAALESTSLNRCWRDLHTASQHILLKVF